MKEAMQKLRNTYPYIDKITIEYNGSGDSFNEFYNFEFISSVPIIKEPDESELEELLFNVIDSQSISFNDDGSHGQITLDLQNNTIDISDYYYYTTSEHNFDNTITFETDILND